MHVLNGYYRTESGAIERAAPMLVDRRGDNFFDCDTGERLMAQLYHVTQEIFSIEIISEHTNTDVAGYTAFLPDVGECERIGMPVTDQT